MRQSRGSLRISELGESYAVDVVPSDFASSVVAMRRTLPLLVTATLLFAACGSDGDNATNETTAVQDTSATTDQPTDTSETDTSGSVAPPPTNPDKPEVEIPDEIPTELVVTVLEEGTGPVALSLIGMGGVILCVVQSRLRA